MTIVQRDNVYMKQWISNTSCLCGHYKNGTNSISSF